MNQDELEKVFVDTFSEYGDAIFRFCLVKVSNMELAEDMTQEVFARYWQYLRRGKEMTNTRSFLYTVANNMAKDWYKKKKADSLDEKMEAGYTPTEKTADPEQAASYREVLSVIEGMEERDREVLLLRYVEGLPPKDIAELLGESANTVSVRLTRANDRLKRKLCV